MNVNCQACLVFIYSCKFISHFSSNSHISLKIFQRLSNLLKLKENSLRTLILHWTFLNVSQIYIEMKIIFGLFLYSWVQVLCANRFSHFKWYIRTIPFTAAVQNNNTTFCTDCYNCSNAHFFNFFLYIYISSYLILNTTTILQKCITIVYSCLPQCLVARYLVKIDIS